MAVDQDPVEHALGRERAARDRHRRQRVAHAVAEVAEHEVDDEAGQPDRDGLEIGARHRHDLRVRAERAVEGLGVRDDRDQEHRHDCGDPQPLAHDLAGLRGAPGPMELGDGRRHRHQRAREQEHRGPQDVAAERDPREIHRPDAARHDRVHHAHGHLEELGEHQRAAEDDEALQLDEPRCDRRRGRRGFGLGHGGSPDERRDCSADAAGGSPGVESRPAAPI